MADTRATIPEREQFKAAEVCEIAGVQPYVLRSWEMEFPSIGASRTPGGPRVYRRGDVERILRIKALVFGEGLTLAGARRRLEEEDAPADPPGRDLPVGRETREKLGQIKDGLRALLALLGEAPPPSSRGAWPPAAHEGLLEFEGAEGAAAVPAGSTRKAAKKRAARS